MKLHTALGFLAIFLFSAISPHHVFANDWQRFLIEKDVSYGSDPLQKLDLCAPKGQKSLKPVHIYIHGGAWQIGDKKGSYDHGKFYCDEGIVFASINYRLSPKDIHPAQAQDSAAAVRWVYDHIGEYGGDRNNIHLSGHSAGAHLAALIGSDPKYLGAHGLSPTLFKTVIPVDTASFDFSNKTRPRFVQKIVDRTFGTSPEELAEASPITYARSNKNLPPFLLFVTKKRDDAMKQTQAFHDAIKSSGGESQMYAIDGLSHREMNKGMHDPDSLISKTILKAIRVE